jgi:hypothetical protein
MKRLQMNWLIILVVGISAMFFLWSCYPDSGLNSVGDYDLVITQYDPDQDFSEFVNFVMPDSIIHIVDEDQDDDISREYDEQILERIADNMSGLGYTEIDTSDAQTADVILLVSVTTTDWKGYSYYPGYGGWWGWWGYPSYPWYPYYPGYAVPYNFTTGSILIEWIDVDDYDPVDDTLPVRWGAVVNGLLDDTESNIRVRLNRDIDQAFNQSPYLGR